MMMRYTVVCMLAFSLFVVWKQLTQAKNIDFSVSTTFDQVLETMLLANLTRLGDIFPPQSTSLLVLNEEYDDSLRMKRMEKYKHFYNFSMPTSSMLTPFEKVEMCGDNPDYTKFFSKKSKERSRFQEDKSIYELFFKGQLRGNETYLELGAYNGMEESNTHFFDACLSWKGLLIEGVPDNYKKVVKKRPRAHCMSLAPSCSAEYEALNRTIKFYKYPMANAGLPGYAKTYEGRPTVDVPCGPLGPIIKDIFPDGLSFFSLDVEGSEAMVLNTIDFQKVKIHVVMIEIKNKHCANDACVVRQQVRYKMHKAGYHKHEGLIPASDVYVHPDSPYRLKR